MADRDKAAKTECSRQQSYRACNARETAHSWRTSRSKQFHLQSKDHDTDSLPNATLKPEDPVTHVHFCFEVSGLVSLVRLRTPVRTQIKGGNRVASSHHLGSAHPQKGAGEDSSTSLVREISIQTRLWNCQATDLIDIASPNSDSSSAYNFSSGRIQYDVSLPNLRVRNTNCNGRSIRVRLLLHLHL